MQNLDLVILAGGKGTRIKKFLFGKPKPLIKINKKPFITYILNHYSKFNFKKIYILAGHKGHLFKKKYHERYYNTSEIEVIIEKKPMDTGGALFSLKKKIKNDFILLNGDSILKLSKIKKLKKNSIYLTKNNVYKSNHKLNGLSIDKNNNIISDKKSTYMNAGVYYFKSSFLKHVRNKAFSLEKDLIPQLISEEKIKGIVTKDLFIDIGTPKNLRKAPKILKNSFLKPAVFLDRDGVLNYDKGYTHKFKDFKFKFNVIRALKYFIKKNYYIFVVTNQAGIAKGYYTQNNFFELHKKLNHYLSKFNIYIDDLKFCPYHPKAKIKKYKKNSNFRKPGNLMLEDLIKNWQINKSKSFMIGDKNSDFEAARKSKIYFEFDQDNLYKQSLKIIKKFNS